VRAIKALAEKVEQQQAAIQEAKAVKARAAREERIKARPVGHVLGSASDGDGSSHLLAKGSSQVRFLVRLSAVATS
jgi:hypothetical protein